jgi:hypothetical protein
MGNRWKDPPGELESHAPPTNTLTALQMHIVFHYHAFMAEIPARQQAIERGPEE